jgi:hypothetical protein
MKAHGAPDGPIIVGEIIEVDPPRKLVQTWHPSGAPQYPGWSSAALGFCALNSLVFKIEKFVAGAFVQFHEETVHGQMQSPVAASSASATAHVFCSLRYLSDAAKLDCGPPSTSNRRYSVPFSGSPCRRGSSRSGVGPLVRAAR